MKILVDVTENDIRDGWTANGNHCALSRGIERALGTPVFCGMTTYLAKGKWSPLPSEAISWLMDFLPSGEASPFQFQLDVEES